MIASLLSAIATAVAKPIIEVLIRSTRDQPHVLTYGKRVAIRTFDGKYVQTDLSKGGEIFARRVEVRAWEIFEIVDPAAPLLYESGKAVKYGDKVSFRAVSSGRFVGIALDRSNELVATVPWVKAWETFSLIPPGPVAWFQRRRSPVYGASFSLRGCNEKAVSYNPGSERLTAHVDHVREWEVFSFIDPSAPK